MDAMLSVVGGHKKALLLGAGFVTRPTAQILSDSGIQVTVACRTLESAQKLSEGLKNCHPISLDVTDSAALEAEIAKNDVAISLIPYTFHATVIKAAINQKKHVVTTSYVSPAMMELDAAAKDAGITVMNEIGLDPGIDHLYAVKTIDEVHKAGGKITSFLSYCGGLPAPEDSGNPLGYKFSWSSRGVLLALRNAGKIYQDGKVLDIAGPELMSWAKPYFIYPGYAFVAYPNRDSTPYKERYNIPEADTIIRGTLRYQGFPEFIKTLVDLGFLNDEEKDFLKPIIDQPVLSWKEATAKIIGSSSHSEQDLIWAVGSKTKFADNEEKDRIIAGLKWVGLFSDEKIEPRVSTMFRTALVRSARCIAPRAQSSIVRRATPSTFSSKIAAPSASIPSIRFYSAHAGLSKDEVQGRIVDLLKNFDKVSDASKLGPSSHFTNDLGLDSLDTVEVVMAIEEEFSIEIPDKEADAIHSVNQAVEYIMSQPDAH